MKESDYTINGLLQANNLFSILVGGTLQLVTKIKVFAA